MNDRWFDSGRCWRAPLLCALTLLAGCHSVQRISREATDKLLREPTWQTVELGLREEFPPESRSMADVRRNLAAAREAGASVLRVGLRWDAMEPQRGVYEWSFWDELVRAATQEYGLRLVPYVAGTPKWAAKETGEDFARSLPRDPEDFARFMSALVGRYHDAIQSWELWNAPANGAAWRGTPAEYAALFRAGSTAVRSADPKAHVVLGGVATALPFLESLFRDEHLAPAIDVVNVETDLETRLPVEPLPGYLRRAAAIVRRYGPGKPLWLAGTSYSAVGARPAEASMEDAQAIALVRTGLMALSSGEVGLIACNRINDLRRSDGSAKPAAAAFAQMARIFAEPYRVVQLPVKTLERRGADPMVCAFELSSGRYVIGAWMSPPPLPGATGAPSPDARHARVEVKLPLNARIVALSNARATPLPANRVAMHGARASFELRGDELVLCVAEP